MSTGEVWVGKHTLALCYFKPGVANSAAGEGQKWRGGCGVGILPVLEGVIHCSAPCRKRGREGLKIRTFFLTET